MTTTITATKRTTETHHTPRHTASRATDTPPEPAECPSWCQHHAWDDIEYHVGHPVEVELPGGGYLVTVWQQPVDGSDPTVFLELSDGTPGRTPTFVDVPAEQWSHLTGKAIR